jgi:hypothetical protein
MTNSLGKTCMASGILLTVIAFNLVAVFGVAPLLHDDPAHYYLISLGQGEHSVTRPNPLAPLLGWPLYKLMHFSPPLARLATVLLFMIPVSWLLYLLYRQRFAMCPMAAFAAAVVPNILPHQWQIPAGINMSYPLWELLPLLAALHAGLDYVAPLRRSHPGALPASILCFTAAALIIEQTVFLVPPLIYLFWRLGRNQKKKFVLTGAIGALTLLRMLHISLTFRSHVLMETHEILSGNAVVRSLSRFWQTLQWSLPIEQFSPLTIGLLLFALLASGVLLMRRKAGHILAETHVESAANCCAPADATFFFVLWLVCSGAFLPLCATYFSPRYVFIPAFAVSGLLAQAVDSISKRLRSHGRMLVMIGLVVAVGTVGIQRTISLNKIFRPLNDRFKVLQNALASYQFPVGAQIVVVGTGIGGGKYRSSGYLQHLLRRSDVTGLISKQASPGGSSLFDRFATHRKFNTGKYSLAGLTLRLPLFLFYCDGPRLVQLCLFLHWQGNGPAASWTIWYVDPASGRLAPFARGYGLSEYVECLTHLGQQGIPPSAILWGGGINPFTDSRAKIANRNDRP